MDRQYVYYMDLTNILALHIDETMHIDDTEYASFS